MTVTYDNGTEYSQLNGSVMFDAWGLIHFMKKHSL